MAQKNATPTEEQQITIAKAGLNPVYWTVVKEMRYTMILCNRETKEIIKIGK